MEDRLRLNAAARSVIHGRSLTAHPREACGLLIGTGNHALRAVPCRNLAEEPDRFELHPEDFLAAEVGAQAEGLAVIGVWHSHPDQPAVPSERDRVDAYGGWVHVICSVGAHGVHSLRSWRIAEGEFTELPIAPAD